MKIVGIAIDGHRRGMVFTSERDTFDYSIEVQLTSDKDAFEFDSIAFNCGRYYCHAFQIGNRIYNLWSTNPMRGLLGGDSDVQNFLIDHGAAATKCYETVG